MASLLRRQKFHATAKFQRCRTGTKALLCSQSVNRTVELTDRTKAGRYKKLTMCDFCLHFWNLMHTRCPRCDNDLSIKPARGAESGSPCSDWVAELDAARDHIARLMNSAYRSGRPKLGHELCKVELALQVLVNAQRRRSATDQAHTPDEAKPR